MDDIFGFDCCVGLHALQAQTNDLLLVTVILLGALLGAQIFRHLRK